MIKPLVLLLVADLHSFYADPDLDKNLNADPDEGPCA
jgi:hypothetical protein